jgi:peptide-methionine (S)-S-oxide reductase
MSVLDYFRPAKMPDPDRALPGRPDPIEKPGTHSVLGTPLAGPWPDGTQTAVFAFGCFWGAEKDFWERPGVVSTAVGYVGGFTPNPNYREVCTGQTGHAEAVLVAYDPSKISYTDLLRVFWESHDPTQAMRQGNDVGTQYRSLIQVSNDEERRIAEASRDAYQEMLTKAGYGQIMTEITERTPFYYAEDYHQQYLDKVPNGYCPLHATGVKLPLDFEVTPLQYVD